MEEIKDVDTVVKDIQNVLEATAPEDVLEREIKSIFERKFSKEFSSSMKSGDGSCSSSLAHLDCLPDTVLLKIFSNFSLPELCHISLVCKHWQWIVYDSELWRYVDLSHYTQITENHILNLIQARLSPLLKTLDLSNREITPVIMNELSEHCHQLDTLVLQNCHLQQDTLPPESLTNTSSVPDKLVRLDVRNFKQGFYFVHLILEANDLSHLECFGFGNNDFCPAFTEFHTIFRKMHALRVLECVHCADINDAQIRLFADQLDCLESLVLTKCENIVGSSLPYLIEKAKCLKSLNLSETNVRSECLVQTPWQDSIIEELDLSFCLHVEAEGLTGSLPRIRTIQHLKLHNVGKSKGVTPALFESDFEHGCWPHLEVLCLRFCNKFTEDGLRYFEKFSTLKFLSLRSCFKLSYTGVSGILKHLPHLQHLECGSLLLSQESICVNWMGILDSSVKHCKMLQKLVLVKCAGIAITKLSDHRKQFEEFFKASNNLEVLCILYSEESIVRLLQAAARAVGKKNVVITDKPGLEIIPRFRHSLDTELNRERFKTFTV